jgi:hypothetical protein
VVYVVDTSETFSIYVVVVVDVDVVWCETYLDIKHTVKPRLVYPGTLCVTRYNVPGLLSEI